MQDMHSKHRYGNRVITKEQKEEIIRLRKSGISQRQVAKQFGVNKGVIKNATKGLLVSKNVRPAKRVILLSDSGLHEFPSVRKASQFLEIGHCTLVAASRGNREIHGYTIQIEL